MPALPPYVLPVLYGLGVLLVAFMGRHRKWGFWGYFWASIVMSPVLGLLFVLAGDKPQWRPKSAAPAKPAPTLAPAPRPAAPAAGTQARAASVPAAPPSPSSTS
jgi:hypothetical protein